MNALVLGGSWNIIGWIILGIAALTVAFLVYGLLAVIYTALETTFYWRWHRFWCRRGKHLRQSGFEFSIEKVEFEDKSLNGRVYREYDVQTNRCLTCATIIAQEKKLANEKCVSAQDMRRMIPLHYLWAERH